MEAAAVAHVIGIMRSNAPRAAAVAALVVGLRGVASAQAGPAGSPVPSPSPSTGSPAPSPSASPSPQPGRVRWSVDAHATFVSSASGGPGLRPPEAAGFVAGSPLSPNTPYDVFSSAPLVAGNAVESAWYVRPAYTSRAFTVSLNVGAGWVRGSTTIASYWGESLFATLNPHLGATRLPYRIAFPAHAGGDDGSAFVASILGGTIATNDGALALRAGWFDLAQTLPFVFAQPPVTNAPPAIALATTESLGGGTAALDAWGPPAAMLPLHGVDVVAKRGAATIEISDAALPAPPATPVRLRSVALVVDRGGGLRLAGQIATIATGGAPVGTTVLFGADPSLLSTAQGALPSSTIGGQRERIYGASAALRAARNLDALLEFGVSTYDADGVARPGTGHVGRYEHAGLSRTAGAARVALDVYRNEPYYATALLPYGAAENVWSAAWSWPGQWLKSNYQLINDVPVNVDRQGYRASYTVKGSALEAHAAYANFGEIAPLSLGNALQTGFVDGFFLPQPDAGATLGRQHQYALFFAWHPALADLTLDLVDDTMRRPGVPGRAQDNVSYEAPEAVLTLSRRVSPAALLAAGVGRYAMRGSFSATSTNVDYAERVGFIGAQFAQGAHGAALLTLRRATFAGIPSALGGRSPDFAAWLLVLEQRYRL
ncbi:MAG: hypothetical protein JOZ24_07065 [Candidatus Eremiobacteraeota bacterium]|nr:hypothetical protein [Candidatus Eremiobacteraeota bacterium]